MYERVFRRASQTRRFTITHTLPAGWVVREEEDSQVIRNVRYQDWHRVERASMTFAWQARTLLDAGWVEAE